MDKPFETRRYRISKSLESVYVTHWQCLRYRLGIKLLGCLQYELQREEILLTNKDCWNMFYQKNFILQRDDMP
jgi:hypothetical protein